MSADYPGAEEHLLDPIVMFPTNAHKAIVIHKTAGDPTPASVYQTFKSSAQLPRSDPNWGRSAHFAVGQDGSIWQLVPLAKGAGANGQPGANMDSFWTPLLQQYGNLNTCTISIEHCDPSSSNQTALTSAQKKASFALVAWLCKQYGIDSSHIKPHNSISATTCPGNYPMSELIQFVKQGGSMIPKGWKDDGHTLTSIKDGKPTGSATLGFRSHIINYPGGWDPSDYILGTEFHADPLEYSNPALGSGQKLCCTKTTLEYTKERGVFEAYQGQEINALLHKLNAQPAPVEARPVDTTPVISAIEAIADGLAPLIASALIETKKL